MKFKWLEEKTEIELDELKVNLIVASYFLIPIIQIFGIIFIFKLIRVYHGEPW